MAYNLYCSTESTVLDRAISDKAALIDLDKCARQHCDVYGRRITGMGQVTITPIVTDSGASGWAYFRVYTIA